LKLKKGWKDLAICGIAQKFQYFICLHTYFYETFSAFPNFDKLTKVGNSEAKPCLTNKLLLYN
jgi:hypothetical protein